MADNIHYRLDSLPTNSKFFIDSTNYAEIFELINSQEKPIKIYDEALFSEILVIERKENNVNFFTNSMIQLDRKKINEKAGFFIDKFPKDGIWIWDLKQDKLIYDYQEKESLGRWVYFCREQYGNFLAMDGGDLNPIKFYNAQNKSALYWSVYYVNAFLTNPSGSLADEEGVKIMMNFICKLYNLPSIENFEYNKQHIMEAVSVFEKETPHIRDPFLNSFRELYMKSVSKRQKTIEENEVIHIGTEKKESEVGLVLSETGRIFLSDLVDNDIPTTFYLIDIDLIVDKRVTEAFVNNGILTFATNTSLSRKDINEIISMMGRNKKHTEVKSNAELDFLLSASEQYAWFDKHYGDM